MNKVLLLTITLAVTLFGVEIPTKHAQEKAFGKSIELNAQIIQLSNASQSIMSQVGGHIEKYFVKVGQNVQKGQKIVLIESIMLSKMTADFISQKKQLKAQEKNYEASKSLYEKGMTSMQELNAQSIKKDELLAKLTALESQLQTLGINTSNLNKASANFVLYAHSDGRISEIFQALHSSVQEDTPIISVVKNQAFYLKSFLPIEYAAKVSIGQKLVIDSNGKKIISHVTQILPNIDEKTQRIVLLSSIDEKTSNLYINAYTSATLFFNSTKTHVAIEKSALSFFQNEWVVFIPNEEEHDGLDSEDAHAGHDHGEHQEHKEEEKAHSEHEEHGHADHGDEEEAAYSIRVVKVVAQDEKFVAVEGLEVGEEYVSDKSYYVKSLLLKSSLGGHGH